MVARWGNRLAMAVAGAVAAGGLVVLPAYGATAPVVDESLRWTGFTPCAHSAPGTYTPASTGSPMLRAMVRDAEALSLAVEFAVWPVTDPAQRTVLPVYAVANTVATVGLPDTAGATEPNTYAWAARAYDGTSWSLWSAACYFTVDNTPPSAPDLQITSVPLGGPYDPTQPIGVTISPAGGTDVEGYEFSWMGVFPVPGCEFGPGGVMQNCQDRWGQPLAAKAPSLGAAVSTALPLPDPMTGIATLYYRSVDRAGLPSETRVVFLQFAPRVGISLSTDTPTAGQRFTMTMSSPFDTVSGFEVIVDEGRPKVARSRDGHTASLALRLPEGAHVITVRQVLSRGSFGATDSIYLDVAPPA